MGAGFAQYQNDPFGDRKPPVRLMPLRLQKAQVAFLSVSTG
jgi:hypothetical protein